MVNSGEEETGEKEEEQRVEVKTVKYRELIQQAERREEDSRDVRSGERERVRDDNVCVQVTSPHGHTASPSLLPPGLTQW